MYSSVSVYQQKLKSDSQNQELSLWKSRPAYAFHILIIKVYRTPIHLAEKVPHLLVKNEGKNKPDDQKTC
jgi:hypothetical protein